MRALSIQRGPSNAFSFLSMPLKRGMYVFRSGRDQVGAEGEDDEEAGRSDKNQANIFLFSRQVLCGFLLQLRQGKMFSLFSAFSTLHR